MTATLTPDMLRKIADALRGNDPYGVNVGHAFICNAAQACFSHSVRNEVRRLLLDAGMTIMDGTMGMRICDYPNDYQRTAQPVRFMLLEFLALMLEDES